MRKINLEVISQTAKVSIGILWPITLSLILLTLIQFRCLANISVQSFTRQAIDYGTDNTNIVIVQRYQDINGEFPPILIKASIIYAGSCLPVDGGLDYAINAEHTLIGFNFRPVEGTTQPMLVYEALSGGLVFDRHFSTSIADLCRYRGVTINAYFIRFRSIQGRTIYLIDGRGTNTRHYITVKIDPTGQYHLISIIKIT